MARYGLSVEALAHTLEAALQGLTVSQVLEGRYAFDLANGVNGELTHHGGVRAVVVGGSEAEREQVNQHLNRALTTGGPEADEARAQAPQSAAADGAASRIGGLFGD